jgi:hypothetical protein
MIPDQQVFRNTNNLDQLDQRWEVMLTRWEKEMGACLLEEMAGLKEETAEDVMGAAMESLWRRPLHVRAREEKRRPMEFLRRRPQHVRARGGTKTATRGEEVGTRQQPMDVSPSFFCFGKLEIGNRWRELIFNLAYSFSNLPKHNICQVTFGKLLEMLYAFPDNKQADAGDGRQRDKPVRAHAPSHHAKY